MNHKDLVDQSPSASDIAQLVGGTVVGDSSCLVTGLASIEHAKAGDLTFVSDSRYQKFIGSSDASVILIGLDLNIETSQTCIAVEDPSWAFSLVAETFLAPRKVIEKGVHEQAIISSSAQIGDDVSIAAGVVIGDHVVIGAGTVIEANVHIGPSVKIGSACHLHALVSIEEGTLIGDRVVIHGGSVIGSDGFGYAMVKGVLRKIPQIGIVVIEDDVEIGANVAIDRARFDRTVIGAGTKIDNLVQIAHNVEIGQSSIVVAQTGIAGSVKIGQHVTLAGQVGVAGHVRVSDGAVVAARSVVTKNIDDAKHYSGFPAIDHDAEKKLNVLRKKLPQLYERVKLLEKAMSQLETSED